MKISFLPWANKQPSELDSLRRADLRGADLRSADLSGANLYGADISRADLYRADLRGANFSGANLRGADLRGANLRGADLSGADLRGAEGLAQFCILPQGDIIGWKKLANGAIARLLIPHDAKRVNAYSSRKCRAEFVFVTKIIGAAEGTGKFDEKTIYKTGVRVSPDSYDPDARSECSNGIHFFITRQEAEDY